MVIIDKCGLVFIHIPKTAGTSIMTWMQNNFDARLEGSPHSGIKQIMEKKIKLPPNAKFFTVVRNPFARLFSHYYYYLQGHRVLVQYQTQNNIENPRNVRILERLERGFEHWLLSDDLFVRQDPRWWDYRWTNQHEWINDQTHVLKYENLASEIKWLYDMTGCNKSLTMENVSGSGLLDYKEQYSKEMRELAEKKFKVDLEKYDYEF